MVGLPARCRRRSSRYAAAVPAALAFSRVRQVAFIHPCTEPRNVSIGLDADGFPYMPPITCFEQSAAGVMLEARFGAFGVGTPTPKPHHDRNDLQLSCGEDAAGSGPVCWSACLFSALPARMRSWCDHYLHPRRPVLHPTPTGSSICSRTGFDHYPPTTTRQ